LIQRHPQLGHKEGLQMKAPCISRITAILLAFAIPVGSLAAVITPAQTPLAPKNIPQFKQALPLLSVQGGPINTVVANNTSFASPLNIRMCEFQTQILPPPLPPTWTFGYVVGPSCPTTVQNTYLGPVLLNDKGIPTAVKYTNALPWINQTNVLAVKYSFDQTLFWADPLNAEANMCHRSAPQPPAVGQGIPAFDSFCAWNFGEDPRAKFQTQLGIPAVPHLHGAEVPPVLDGGPDAWFTALNGNASFEKGHDYYTASNVAVAANEALYRYPNSQGAAPLWFHDHLLGGTRINVYAGIAGVYYLLDPAQEAYFKQINMRPVTEVVPIILQDRQFDTNGQLIFPQEFPGGLNGPPTNPEHPYWIPEFLGDTVVVNGKAWPFLKVEPRRYRFLFLNGSNARTYEMFMTSQSTKAMGPPFWVIGNDGGFLDKPSIIDPNGTKPVETHFIIMPGERYEVIIDFSKVAGQNIILKNVGKTPFPGGAAPQGTTLGQLMQFQVAATCTTSACPDTTYDPASGIALRPTPIVRLTNPATGTPATGLTIDKTRLLTLNEVALPAQTAVDPVTNLTTAYPGGPVEILVNNTTFSGESKNRPYNDFTPVTVNLITELVSETQNEGDTELWEIVNTTADAHPIHLHLATFQLLNRQSFDGPKYFGVYSAAFPGDGTAACPAAVYCPAFGPPMSYDPAKNALSAGKWGGNPDITPFLNGPVQLPDPDEVGWKDTFVVYPGMVNRIIVRFAPTDTPFNVRGFYPFAPNDGTNGALSNSHGYVWHCHILDHEDNEMMRPTVMVNAPNATRTYIKGVDF
jgi:FtsP/CotA-like multicopper oxidase with cupredoxin domain